MDTYDGAATVVADGNEYACHAMLRRRTERIRSRPFGGPSISSGRTSWDGTLTLGGDAYAVYAAEDLQLRISRTSSFTIGEGGDLGSGTLRIKGNNAAPFD
ncbi:hypothetical protein ACGFX8_16040 [Streptomyces sp. NPDC048362]|uniref:hypothetical protein n=1 Tax=Streptomyces sp. NPDC048362 TaxID=3365539 RepID=UPI003723F3FA